MLQRWLRTDEHEATAPRWRMTLLLIVALGFGLRVLFWLVGADLYYDGSIYTNNDALSYMGSMHFFESGVYTFNPNVPDARFGRVPVYPIFWGLHYLLTGFNKAATLPFVAGTQLILDCVGIYLLHQITVKATGNRRAGLVAAAIYACYPFIIVWLPITGTEAFATFLSILTIYVYQRTRERLWPMLLVGAMIGTAILTREYLGLLLPTISLMILVEHRRLVKVVPRVALLTLGMLLVYGLWPARNYFLHDELIWLRPENSGYHRYEKDITRARYWINGWAIYSDNYLNPMTKGDGTVDFPDEVFTPGSPYDEAYANELIQRGRVCGRGFYSWQNNHAMPEGHEDCTEEVADGFNKLTSDFVEHQPIEFWVKTPARNFRKIFFKSRLTDPLPDWRDRLVQLLFFYRSALLLLGFAGAWVYRRTPLVVGIAGGALLMYAFLALGLRAVEMRYLLQFDCLMLISAALLVNRIVFERGNARKIEAHSDNRPSESGTYGNG